MNSREQFEAFCLDFGWMPHHLKKIGDRYEDWGVQPQWMAWKAAYEAGRAASRRPIAIIQRSGNSWNVFEQRYNDDRTERNDRLIRGGFVTSVDATSWARSNGYEVEA